MKHRKLIELKQAWADATRLKTPAERRAALETFLDVPFDVLLSFAKKGRKSVQRRLGPHVVGEGRSYIVATSSRKNILFDAVHIFARRSHERIEAEQILICDQIIVGFIPNGCYWVRELVRAAAGSFGGCRIVNVDEFIGGVRPKFSAEFEQHLPRLKTYKFRGSPVRCAWSVRGLELREWAERLENVRGDKVLATLKELHSTMASTQAIQEVWTRIRKALNPALTPFLSSTHPDTKLWAWRAWNAIGNKMPPHGFRHRADEWVKGPPQGQ
jgi:hypothetical protein